MVPKLVVFTVAVHTWGTVGAVNGAAIEVENIEHSTSISTRIRRQRRRSVRHDRTARPRGHLVPLAIRRPTRRRRPGGDSPRRALRCPVLSCTRPIFKTTGPSHVANSTFNATTLQRHGATHTLRTHTNPFHHTICPQRYEQRYTTTRRVFYPGSRQRPSHRRHGG